MSTAHDIFLRRFATSPIHVPRLERLLAVYDDEFASRFIEWDRECPDVEAARIVAEILSEGDANGRIVRLDDEGVRAAIRWMSVQSPLSIAERADRLRVAVSLGDPRESAIAIAAL